MLQLTLGVPLMAWLQQEEACDVDGQHAPGTNARYTLPITSWTSTHPMAPLQTIEGGAWQGGPLENLKNQMVPFRVKFAVRYEIIMKA